MLKKYSITKQAYIPFTIFFSLTEDAFRNSEHLETENICCRKQHRPIQKHSLIVKLSEASERVNNVGFLNKKDQEICITKNVF